MCSSIKKTNQTITGKAFEYSLLLALNNELKRTVCIEIIENEPYRTVYNCHNTLSAEEQENNILAAHSAVNFLIDLEPRLINSIDLKDILEIEIVSDQMGQKGDVRDVLAIRSKQDWEIGISAKNNHRAIKHSRLSNNIDFGYKWLGVNCSTEYFKQIKPVFDNLNFLKEKSQGKQRWNSLENYHESIYEPILTAFKDELYRLCNKDGENLVKKLVEYLIGFKDFYKVIKQKESVEIQAYNLYGTLNSPFNDLKAKYKIPRLKLPSRLIEIAYSGDSKTTLIVTMDEGWQISFRIHNASSRIEPSLKFDINLVSTPHSLYTHHINYLNPTL